MDISSDGALIASGSADKNLKIWGMDFGDCHKSLFAHGDRYNNLGLWSELSSLLCFLELQFYWAVKVFDSIA
jgi:WD40 repeat protein